jgi:adenylate cyclase class IV
MNNSVKALYQSLVELHISIDTLSDIYEILMKLGFRHYGGYILKLINLYKAGYQETQEELKRQGFKPSQLN